MAQVGQGELCLCLMVIKLLKKWEKEAKGRLEAGEPLDSARLKEVKLDHGVIQADQQKRAGNTKG